MSDSAFLVSPAEISSSQAVMSASNEKSLHASHLTKGFELVFKNISIKVDKTEILTDVSGIAKPGELVAVMGPSGAGKSTLLNAMAGRLSLDSGIVTLNSQPLTKQLRRKVSYVLQDDVFMPELTFWDTIWYTALLRLPQSMDIQEKRERVQEIIDGLDMKKCLKTRIGDLSNRGLSGGEKKRANIACELLTNPALMLLDEPTSGLDSTTAFNLMSTLKMLAQQSGKTIVTTIHQPSSQIFSLFDRLLLLCDGKVAYSGCIENCTAHFESVGFTCPSHYNAADFILDCVKDADDEMKIRMFEHAKEQQLEFGWQVKSDEDSCGKTAQHANGKIQSFNSKTEDTTVKFAECIQSEENIYQKEYDAKWPQSYLFQYSVLTRRAFKQMKPKIFDKIAALQNLLVGIFVGIIYFRTKPVEFYIDDRLGLMYFAVSFLAYRAVRESLAICHSERPVLNKERLAGYYRLSAYYLAKITSEFPVMLLPPFMFFPIAYWMVGLNYNFYVFVQLQFIMCLCSMVSQALGSFYGVLMEDAGMALYYASTTILCSMLAGGFIVKQIPFWMKWIQYVSFIRYAYLGSITIDLINVDIRCSENSSLFCSDQTSNLTEQMYYIPRHTLLNYYSKSSGDWQLWHYICMLISMAVLLRLMAYFTLRFLRKPASTYGQKI